MVSLTGVCMRQITSLRNNYTGMCLHTNDVYLVVIAHILRNTGTDSEHCLGRIPEFKDSEYFPRAVCELSLKRTTFR